jgi:ankyrin repeat protein
MCSYPYDEDDDDDNNDEGDEDDNVDDEQEDCEDSVEESGGDNDIYGNATDEDGPTGDASESEADGEENNESDNNEDGVEQNEVQLVDILDFLLESGADINAKGGYHGTALIAATFKGYHKIIKYLVEHGAEINAVAHCKYGFALQAAVEEDSAGDAVDTATLLLQLGADPNTTGGQYHTALQAAHARPETLKLLVEAGADVNLVGGKYGTALQAAHRYVPIFILLAIYLYVLQNWLFR